MMVRYLPDMLDAPIPKLSSGNEVDVLQNLGNTRTLQTVRETKILVTLQRTNLVILKAILEDILNDKTSRLSESNLMPHSTQSFVDILHDLGWVSRPTEFEELLPNMARI
jgi:hypothetical protein